MASWEPFKVADTVARIAENIFVLPVIQRRFVWEQEKIELLFDSLLKGNSFGGIIVIEEEKGEIPMFAHRHFSQHGTIVSSLNTESPWGQTHYFVIDGQQRLQSFYIGLLGSLDGKELFFDLASDVHDLEFDFAFASEQKSLPKKATNDREEVRTTLWMSVPQLYKRLKKTNDDDQVTDELIRQFDLGDAGQKETLKKNVRRFYKGVFNDNAIGVSKVSVNKTLDITANRQRIVELFRRLNDGGTKLSSFDLIASVMKGYAWEMEGFLDDILARYQSLSFGQDEVLKLILLLQGNASKHAISIEASDAEFAAKHAQRIKCTFAALENFLHLSHLYEYYRESGHSTIPLYFVAYHIFHSQRKDDELCKMFDKYETQSDEFLRLYRWVAISLLNGVFKSRGTGWIPYKTGVRKILEKMKLFRGDAFPEQELYKVYRGHPLHSFTTNITSESLQLFDRPLLFYFLYGGQRQIREQDIDHIHPSSRLGAAGVHTDEINDIANFQLLESGVNRGAKNGKELKEWIENGVQDKDLYVKVHLIPEDQTLWTTERFSDFKAARRVLIVEKLKRELSVR